jgi:predicted outer membrane repeat protein
LQQYSPCIDAGDNSAVPPSLLDDLDHKPRIANHIVDMGAYEKQSFSLSAYSLVIPEGGTESFTVALLDDPLKTVEVTVTHYSGDGDITVVSGGMLTFDSSNYAKPQTVVLAAAEDEDYLNGTAEIWVSGSDLLTAVVTVTEADNEPVPTVLYVDKRATGDNDGWSWNDAFIKLQDALAVAAGYSQVREVRVAQGTYTPAEPFSGDREATFEIVSGVDVRGGYAGLGAADPDAHDVERYETILSGDINGDDGPDFANNTENSYNVVSSWEVDETALLDGFTISDGNGGVGGGMFNVHGSPTVVNCTFEKNFAWGGAAMYNSYSSPTLVNCTFIGNRSETVGAVFSPSYGSQLTITSCMFIDNSTTGGHGEGGAIFRGSPTLTDCTFISNSAHSGGALNCMSGTISRCAFFGNSATFGGALYGGSPSVDNCVFSGN